MDKSLTEAKRVFEAEIEELVNSNLEAYQKLEIERVEQEEPKQEKISFKKEDKFKVNLDEKKEVNA